MANPIQSLLVSLRPWEWSKNLFVFTGLVFAYRFHDPGAVGAAARAFVAFCALSGIAYLINDTCDRASDRQHPEKRARPIASGQLGPRGIGAGVAALVVAVVALAWPLGRAFALWAAAYCLLNVAYSLWLKHIIFLDIACLATGFLIRVFAGCAAVAVPTSGYAVSCAFSLALLLAAGKRRGELLAHGENSAQHRAVFDHYTARMLDVTIGVTVAATLVSYVVFVMSHKHPSALVYTVAFVAVGIYRYLRLLYRGRGAEQPARLVLKDGPLLLTCVAWALAAVAILWSSGYTAPH